MVAQLALLIISQRYTAGRIKGSYKDASARITATDHFTLPFI
jgi:hypothetical protein